MSAQSPKAYRFTKAEQWGKCIIHRFDVSRDGALVPAPRLGSQAAHIKDTTARAGVPSIAISQYGEPFWLTDASGSLGQSPRLIVDREWVWAFKAGGTTVLRFDRESLQPDLTIDVELEVRDITSDSREGIWVLAVETTGEGTAGIVIHYDCEGRERERHRIPCEDNPPLQIASVSRGGQLALLTADRARLLFIDSTTGKIQRVRSIGQLASCWSAAQLASDTRNRIALWGPQMISQASKWLLFVLDGSGDTVDGPIEVSFNAADAPAPRSFESIRTAIHRHTVWFATDSGLWRLDPTEETGARESESTLITPGLLSPDSDTDRGWLRAEVFVDLAEGAAMEAEVATTDEPTVFAQAEHVAGDRSQSSEQQQIAIWGLVDPDKIRRYSIAGPSQPGVPIAIPLLEPRDRWLWLRLSILTPPGTDPAPLKELRVLYPNISIVQHLPAAFRGEKNDPRETLRSIAGVLESTTQRFDERIRSIGSFMDPQTTPVEWLDYLARWLDLPWDDELPDQSKRDVLSNAGAILDRRGTRAGLRTLLRSLVGKDAAISIVDLTVDHAPIRIGGGDTSGGALPALLAGVSMRAAILGTKAVLGRSLLCTDADPLKVIVPMLRISLTASREIQQALEKLLRRVLLQYIPAGVKLSIRWNVAGLEFDEIEENGIVLDANGPGMIGRNSSLGRTVVGGRGGNKLGEAGLGIGFRLR
jgi:phage tail-like protein